MSNFNLKKFLTENRLTAPARLQERMGDRSVVIEKVAELFDRYTPEELVLMSDAMLESAGEIIEQHGGLLPEGMFTDEIMREFERAVQSGDMDSYELANYAVKMLVDPEFYRPRGYPWFYT